LTVVDVGCFPHGHEVSVETLIDRFCPEVLYGFDPWPELMEGEQTVRLERVGAAVPREVRVVLARKAAWVADGLIEIALVGGERAWDSTVMREKNSRREWQQGEITKVACFDFPAWVEGLPEGDLIVKLDAEGAEFPLLDALHERGVDGRVSLLLVEWHDAKMNGQFAVERERLLGLLRCPVEEWA
jgi:hypothetical protein